MGERSDEFVRQRRPGNDDLDYEWRIRRAPADGKPVLYLCISTDIEGVRTHFVGGRTVPHLQRNCVGCRCGKASEWHGYILAIEDRTKDRVLFEFTARAAGPFTRFFEQHGSLRGLVFRASRTRKDSTAPVRIECLRQAKPDVQIPQETDILPLLARIWHVNLAETDTSTQTNLDGMTTEEKMAVAKEISKRRREQFERQRETAFDRFSGQDDTGNGEYQRDEEVA